MKIYPAFDLGDDPHYRSFLTSIEQLLDTLLPTLDATSPEHFFQDLAPHLPLLHSAPLKPNGNAFRITIPSHAEYTHGSGRFLSDALSRRLIPGKIVELVGTRTLSFYFFLHPKKEFLLNERWIMANHPDEIPLIERRLPQFLEELRLTFLSIVKARHFLSFKSQPLPEIQHLSPFEEMHQIIHRLSAEKTMGEIRTQIAPLYKKRPKIFDRDIFEEMKPLLPLYDEKFIGKRKPKEVARLLCTHLYFQKKLTELTRIAPLTRHILLKLFRKPGVTGILILLNLFNELFTKEQLLSAITHCIPDAQEISDSFLIDTTHHLFLYIEIKTAHLPTLRTQLPIALKTALQSHNPLFMLRNEEDHFRSLIALSKELRHVKDLPQIVIHFEEQTKDSLVFTIIMVRLIKPKTQPLKTLLAALPLTTTLREHKTIGTLRKYPKEASLFRAHLPKEDYLRQDYSLDLPRARQTLLHHLSQIHPVRDYNGGLLFQQLSALHHLQQRLPKEHTFAIENFFFSIEPISAQMTLTPSHLQEGFQLLATPNIRTTTAALPNTPKSRHFLEALRTRFDIAYALTPSACILFFHNPAVRILCHAFQERDQHPHDATDDTSPPALPPAIRPAPHAPAAPPAHTPSSSGKTYSTAPASSPPSTDTP